jgi:hypothetical protein
MTELFSMFSNGTVKGIYGNHTCLSQQTTIDENDENLTTAHHRHLSKILITKVKIDQIIDQLLLACRASKFVYIKFLGLCHYFSGMFNGFLGRIHPKTSTSSLDSQCLICFGW